MSGHLGGEKGEGAVVMVVKRKAVNVMREGRGEYKGTKWRIEVRLGVDKISAFLS